MRRNDDRVLIKNFWKPYPPKFTKTDLTADEVGWTIELQTESGGYTDTKDVWDSLISHDSGVGFDLIFFFLDNMRLYYLDNFNQVLYLVPPNENWDGNYLENKYDYEGFDKETVEEIFDFDKTSEVWDKFTIDGHDMKYILEHSVLFLDT